MTMGAMSAWLMIHTGASLPAGVLTAAIAGAVLGLIHALWTVRWGLPQPVVGIAMSLLAMNLSYFTVRAVLPDVTSPPTIDTFLPVAPALTGDVPLVGPVLATFTWYTYAALVLAMVFAFMMQRTPLGLAIRLVGENPLAAESQGINVHLVRFAAVTTGSALMAIGGAFLRAMLEFG
jgi:general nucleoside transport system permease protein